MRGSAGHPTFTPEPRWGVRRRARRSDSVSADFSARERWAVHVDVGVTGRHRIDQLGDGSADIDLAVETAGNRGGEEGHHRAVGARRSAMDVGTGHAKDVVTVRDLQTEADLGLGLVCMERCLARRVGRDGGTSSAPLSLALKLRPLPPPAPAIRATTTIAPRMAISFFMCLLLGPSRTPCLALLRTKLPHSVAGRAVRHFASRCSRLAIVG